MHPLRVADLWSRPGPAIPVHICNRSPRKQYSSCIIGCVSCSTEGSSTHPVMGVYASQAGRENNRRIREGQSLRQVTSVEMNQSKQNADLPPVLPKRKKKPYLIPLPLQKKRRRFHSDILTPPADGLLVEELIPIAHQVMEARKLVIEGVTRLLKVYPIQACRFCPDIHVGPVGHKLQTCRGPKRNLRAGFHDWLKGNIDDVLVPTDSYHLADRLALQIPHDQRFDIERIPAVEELCIQAGVDVPRYPTLRRTVPIKSPKDKLKVDGQDDTASASSSWQDVDVVIDLDLGKFENISLEPGSYGPSNETLSTGTRNISLKEYEALKSLALGYSPEGSLTLDNGGVEELPQITDDDDLQSVATKLLKAFDFLRWGARKLMSRYRVLACGYCPEIHIGPAGHKARVCGAYKHQWRDGKHGWQDASVDELIPPQYVWHVTNSDYTLQPKLKPYYGQAPAVVELCVQAGAPVPERWKPIMRLDVVIPLLAEIDQVI